MITKTVYEITEANAVDRHEGRGMPLPFAPISLTFEDIRYSVTMPKVIMLYRFMIHVSHTLIEKKTKKFLLRTP